MLAEPPLLNERTWLNIYEQGLSAFIAWPKRDQSGLYGERFQSFSNFVKATRLFIFNDAVMQKISTAPIFTDGVNIYIQEHLANEFWQSPNQDKELETFRPIHHAIMRSLEIILKDRQDTDQPWKYIEYIPLDKLVKALIQERSFFWLEKIGIQSKKELNHGEIDQIIRARKEVLLWLVSQLDQPLPISRSTPNESDHPEESEDLDGDLDGNETPHPLHSRPPVWLNESNQIIKNRWDECVQMWTKEGPSTFQNWTIKWVLSENLGHLVGAARNELLISGNDSKILSEGWNAGLSGWIETLKAMLDTNDWVSFGRSIYAFIQKCTEHETLSFEEKTEITNVAAYLLDKVPYKMAWVDLLSGSYEYSSLLKFLKNDVDRFSKLNFPDPTSEEALAFYMLLPDPVETTGQNMFGKDFMASYFQDVLEKVDLDHPTEILIENSAQLLKKAIRGIFAEDAIELIEKWLEWSSSKVSDIIEDDQGYGFEEIGVREKQNNQKMIRAIMNSRRWTDEQKTAIEKALT